MLLGYRLHLELTLLQQAQIDKYKDRVSHTKPLQLKAR